MSYTVYNEGTGVNTSFYIIKRISLFIVLLVESKILCKNLCNVIFSAILFFYFQNLQN